MKGRGFLLRGSTPLERRFVGNAFIFTEDAKRELLRDAVQSEVHFTPFDVTAPYYRETAGLDPITRMQYVDLHTWLPGDILMKADKMTMANSIELRVPFLDKQVFEFAATIPMKYRVTRGTTKYVLRQAAAGLLPDAIRRRPKLGFPVPIRQWIREELRDAIYDTVQARWADEYIRSEYVLQLLDAHCQGKRDYARQIWTVFIFLLWYDAYVRRRRTWCSELQRGVMMKTFGMTRTD
jgi:asparagine synthase (glutamine-hydrolysing)